MSDYVAIDSKIYTMEYIAKIFDEEERSSSFDRVDNIVMQFGTHFHHLGRICYDDFKITNKNNCELRVNLASINLDGTQFVKRLLPYLSELLSDGKRVRTLYGNTGFIISLFNHIREIGWVLRCDKSSIRAFVNRYTDHLLHQIKIYDRSLKLGLSTHTAQSYQSQAISFLSYAIRVEESELTGGLPLIQRNNNQVESAMALLDDDLSHQFNLYTQVFRQFSDIVLDHKKLPMPVNLNSEKLWIAPSYSQWLKPKHKKTIGLRGFNYDTGKFYNIEELELLEHCKGKQRYQLGQHISQARNATEKANEPYSLLRLLLAGWACRAYFMHFLIVTGENDSTAASLLFDDEYLTTRSEQHFRSIKWRANGIDVHYDIQNEFVSDFQRYIQLRDYLVKYYQQDYKALFISAAVSKLTKLSTDGNASCNFRRLFSVQFTGKPLTGTSKSFRVSKSLWVRESYGSGISSYIMQHQDRTADSNYTSKNDNKTAEQLTDYFMELDKLLLKDKGTEEPIPSGHCAEPAMPDALPSLPLGSAITVNCGTLEGCLFCSKFRTHADEDDIRKLLSVKYVIMQSQHLAASSEHFDGVYQVVLTRVDDLLARISDVNSTISSVIDKVRKEVFEQERLSEYWYRKLELLEELGLL